MAEEQKPVVDKPDEEVSVDLPLPKSPKSEPKKVQVKGAGAKHHWDQFLAWYKNHKKVSIPLTVLAVLLLSFLLPPTRYSVAGLFIKTNFTLQVKDSVSQLPVSGATVSEGTRSAQTDGQGKATLHLAVGRHKLNVSKKYYKDTSAKVTVPLTKQKDAPSVEAEATGRQVNVNVLDKISKKPVADVDIKVLDITAKTDEKGSALLVLPAGSQSEKATISKNGYNENQATIKVSENQVAENNLTITPSGKVYFLSKLSGKVDVVKTDLDGQNRQTVLAGTGQEDDQQTVLLASRDWKYLALLSRRDSSLAKLYIIDTSNDTTKAFDEGNANFSPLGWYDDYFLYTVGRIAWPAWQSKQASIKSYNAQSGQISVLDNTNATGTSNFDAQYESILSPYLFGDSLIYTKTWYRYPGYLQVAGQQNTLNSIKPDGSGRKVIKSADSANSYFSTVAHNPNSLYVSLTNSNTNQTTYYELTSAGSLNQKNDLSSDTFFNAYPTYLASPGDKSTFWSEARDGKNSLFVGDSDGANGRQIAKLSDYQTYGWYSDKYLLASKNGSELYIFGVDGISKDADALKVTDYHKPAISYPGYGGGYGGI